MDSKRQLQVGSYIKRTISSVFQQEGSYIWGTKALVSVTDVKMSPDLGIAKVYVSVYNVLDKQNILLMIQENQGRLRMQFNQKARKQLRRMPQLHYYIDDMLDEIDRVDQLFRQIKKDDEQK